MLVAQAEMASRLFLGGIEDPPAGPARGARSACRELAEQTGQRLVIEITSALLKKTQNIALIGMPGCGKSTVGRAVAKIMGREFSDVDALIEAAAGKSIPTMFAEEGEEAFRLLETRVLAEESKKGGRVIATGGGVVTRPENLDLLRQNSMIIYLRRDLSALVTNGRPLSQNVGVHSLAEERLPLYEAWSDCVVQAEAAPKLTAARIVEALDSEGAGVSGVKNSRHYREK